MSEGNVISFVELKERIAQLITLETFPLSETATDEVKSIHEEVIEIGELLRHLMSSVPDEAVETETIEFIVGYSNNRIRRVNRLLALQSPHIIIFNELYRLQEHAEHLVMTCTLGTEPSFSEGLLEELVDHLSFEETTLSYDEQQEIIDREAAQLQASGEVTYAKFQNMVKRVFAQFEPYRAIED